MSVAARRPSGVRSSRDRRTIPRTALEARRQPPASPPRLARLANRPQHNAGRVQIGQGLGQLGKIDANLRG